VTTREKLKQVFQEAGKPLKAGEILELSGLAKTDIDKAMKDMKNADEIISPRRCYWELKK
jgi:predicted Zn-ribbon and HTH transcriptional regulator